MERTKYYRSFAQVAEKEPTVPLSAHLRLKKISSSTPESLHANRITADWTSSEVMWNHRPASTPDSGTTNISTQGVSEANGWYSMNVTTMTKNMISGSMPKYGWRIRDKKDTDTSHSTKFYSSDADYPNRPELVINYTTGSTGTEIYCGNRAYEQKNGSTCNCLGYAWDVDRTVNAISLQIPQSAIDNISSKSKLDTLAALVNSYTINYLVNKCGKSSSNISVLSSYNSTINTNRYRIVLRVTAWDNNSDGVLTLKSSNQTVLAQDDQWEYHWWYQTNTGQWAEKDGSNPSQRISGTNSNTNPSSASSNTLWGRLAGGSNCIYFSNVQDTSN